MFGFFRSKLATAIEWRVLREVDKEREVIRSLEEQLTATAREYGERLLALEEAFDKIVDGIEK